MSFQMGACTVRCVRGVAVALLVIATPVAFAQDPTAGRTLFSSNSVQACTACHFNVENRRAAIDPGGDLDFEFVLATFLNAISTFTAMRQFDTLTPQEKRDIAAYIADVPKATPNLVNYNATNTGTETAAQTITFTNAVTGSALTLGSIGLTGNSADFVIKTTGTTCSNNQTLAAGASCKVSVSFLTATGSTKTALLNFPYTQAGSANTTRTAQLMGTVATQPPPSSATPPDDGGGGSFGVGWAGLLLLALRLRRRH
jgi:MYXO-CTERM domain-containing protein